ncbi:MAG: T9SS type A sorting domain-containing protein [Ignavibacteriae bacterium]|nr:T9SS type A sorting domain-containing protein [Ignavibacteriota bacterium]
MKKLAFFLLTTLLFSIHLNAQWKVCNHGVRIGEGVCFILDSNNLYYCARDKGVYLSTNNGDSWIAKNNGFINNGDDYYINYIIQSLAMNGNILIAGTWVNGIFLSTDKGNSWMQKCNGLPYDPIQSMYDGNVSSIVFDGDNIYAGTDWGFFISTNNGDSWTQKNNGLLATSITSLAVKENNIFAGTRYSGIFLSTDIGNNWSPKNIAMGPYISQIVIDGDNIIACTGDDGIYISSDNGVSWTRKFSWNVMGINSLIIYNDIFFAARSGVSYSTDYGDTWTDISEGLTEYDIETIIIKDDYIFAGTNSGLIFRAKLSDLITDVKEDEQNINTLITPNPANDFLIINSPYSIGKEISIYDMLGTKLKTFIPEGSGTRINVGSFSNSIYLIKIGEIIKTFVKE